MVLPRGDTFHPKIYLFHLGRDIAAIVGSHNLTPKAFDGNSEMSVLLRGNAGNPEFRQLIKFFDDEWKRATKIDDHIDAYSLQHKAKKRHINALSNFEEHIQKPLRGSKELSPFEMDWKDFVRNVRKRPNLETRLDILAGAARLFQTKSSLSNMERQERKAIGGTYRRQEASLDGRPWGWFGTMGGNGDFSRLVNGSDTLSAALDEIPLSGEVSEADYSRFISGFNRTFRNATHKGSYPTASRLLAMKRPDRFVCVNSKNKRPLCRSMGIHYTTLNLENYWTLIAQPLTLCPWWVQGAPTNPEDSAIWDGRMALLDCIYYEDA